MPNKNYIHSYNLENDVVKFLEAREYHAQRGAGSHKVDVVAFSKHVNSSLDQDLPLMYLWISCKYGSGRMSSDDKRDFIERAKACGVLPVEASRQPHKQIVFKDLERNIELFK